MCATVASVKLSRTGGVRGIVSWNTANGSLLAVILLLGCLQPAFLQFSPCNGKESDGCFSFLRQIKLTRAENTLQASLNLVSHATVTMTARTKGLSA